MFGSPPNPSALGIGADTGADNEAEFHLHQQRQEARTRAEIGKFEYSFLYRKYTGKDAIIAKIVDVPLRSDYSIDLIDRTIAKMAPVEIPGGLSVEQLCAADSEFREKVLATYNEVVAETSGKTDTQLGLKADHVTYR